MFVYKLSGCVFKSRCSHLKKFFACQHWIKFYDEECYACIKISLNLMKNVFVQCMALSSRQWDVKGYFRIKFTTF